MSHNYYKILKVKKTASLKQIKSSYRLLAKKYHPDLNPNNKKSHELFIELEKAYSTLSDPILRKSYDKTLKPLKRNAYKNYKDKYKSNKQDEQVANDALLAIVIIFIVMVVIDYCTM